MTALLRLPSTAGPPDDPRSSLSYHDMRVFAGFWVLGLLNNAAYVVMIAGANEIAASAVGLVYLCAIGPTIVVKITAPYWFHLVGYTARFWVAAFLMSSSFLIVGFSSNMSQQLLGVGLVAVQGGLGEASALAMCSLYPNQLSLTAWSSGTGFAGIAGYAWVAILHYWLGLSYAFTLALANIMPVVWLTVYHLVLQQMKPNKNSKPAVSYHLLTTAGDPLDGPVLDVLYSHGNSSSQPSSAAASPVVELSSRSSTGELPEHHRDNQQQQQQLLQDTGSAGQQQPCSNDRQQPYCDGVAVSRRSQDRHHEQHEHLDASSMTFKQRLKATCALWPYMMPLFVVYYAEYAMQSGTWTAIGFPVTSATARHKFYLYANWTYQAGVCISRSSGMLYQANRLVLWLMPAMQCVLLVFFSLDAVLHLWYGWSLLVLCLLAGLLGGAVYVNSFTLLSKEVKPALKEFSLSAACVADSLGIACADVTAILIQGCLFRWQSLPGAAYACGASR